MFRDMSVYIFLCVCVYMRYHVCMHLCCHVFMHVSVCLCVCMSLCVCVHACLCMCVCMHVSVCVCVCVCACRCYCDWFTEFGNIPHQVSMCQPVWGATVVRFRESTHCYTGNTPIYEHTHFCAHTYAQTHTVNRFWPVCVCVCMCVCVSLRCTLGSAGRLRAVRVSSPSPCPSLCASHTSPWSTSPRASPPPDASTAPLESSPFT